MHFHPILRPNMHYNALFLPHFGAYFASESPHELVLQLRSHVIHVVHIRRHIPPVACRTIPRLHANIIPLTSYVTKPTLPL